MKTIKRLWAAVICTVLLTCTVPVLPVGAADGLLVNLTAADGGLLSYNYAETKKLTLKVSNMGAEDAADIRITPRVSENIDAWPFEIENKDYTQTVEQLQAGQSVNVEFEFAARENVKTQYYKLAFDFTYRALNDDTKKGDGEYGIYVRTVAKPEKDKDDPTQPGGENGTSGGNGASGGNGTLGDNDTSGGNGASGGSDTSGDGGSSAGGGSGAGGSYPTDAGGISNSEPIVTSAGGGDAVGGSVPRVIVTGFTTDPQEVKAGSNFKLTVHLKNTSTKTAVSNMLFDLSAPTEGTDENTSAPAFLPSSGSSSVYLDGIKADGTKDIAIELNAKADLVQKPYSIQLSMKYENAQSTQFESASALSIPVKQDARFEFSEFEISPESVEVDSEANAMCELYNMGRIKLYNVKATFAGKGIKTEEVFVGNVEPGATANIDAMVTGESATEGPQEMKMTLSYEDESGKTAVTEKEFTLEVIEADVDTGLADITVENTKGGFPVIPVVAGVAVTAGAVTGVLLHKKKKKKRQEEEEEGLVDEFDRLTEDEPREP